MYQALLMHLAFLFTQNSKYKHGSMMVTALPASWAFQDIRVNDEQP